jgi:hypothetical protein
LEIKAWGTEYADYFIPKNCNDASFKIIIIIRYTEETNCVIQEIQYFWDEWTVMKREMITAYEFYQESIHWSL